MPSPGAGETQVELVMQGGTGGEDHGGFGTWALNDVSGLPGKPLVDIRRGAPRPGSHCAMTPRMRMS